MYTGLDRIFVLAGGLAGAAGVGLSAAAAHAGGAFTGTAAAFLLMHAPAFLAIGLLGSTRLLQIGGVILLAGLVLFCGDLIARDFLSTRLFPLAAPAGGTLLIAGPHGPPLRGQWRYDKGALTIVEEGRPYPIDILQSTATTLRLRSHNPGEPLHIDLVLAAEPPLPAAAR